VRAVSKTRWYRGHIFYKGADACTLCGVEQRKAVPCPVTIEALEWLLEHRGPWERLDLLEDALSDALDAPAASGILIANQRRVLNYDAHEGLWTHVPNVVEELQGLKALREGGVEICNETSKT
jgi:hypothetical protein